MPPNRLSLIYITDIIRHRQHRLFLPFQVIVKKLTELEDGTNCLQKDAINESKMRFLGNISHELKHLLRWYPQLELILMSNYSLPTIQNSLREVHNRAAKWELLINELLDFLKYKENFSLRIKQQDIVLFTQEIYDSFVSYAELKNTFQFCVRPKERYAWFEVQLQRYSIISCRMLSSSLRKRNGRDKNNLIGFFCNYNFHRFRHRNPQRYDRTNSNVSSRWTP